VKAIVRSGSRQYIAEEGRTVLVERLPLEVGDEVTFDQVLLIADGDETRVGQPLVKGASVTGTVVEQAKGPKLKVFHYRPKKRIRTLTGHRQQYTRVRIDKIAL
jgi:large subunit ribosomal protein L21